MLAIYETLCPSPAVVPDRAADSVQDVLAESSLETPWTGALDEDSLAVMEEGAYGPHLSVQVKLHLATADLEGEVDDALTTCTSSLARSGLNPQRQDHTLTIRGDWETVLAALKRCDQRMRRTRAHHKQPPSIRMAAITGEAPTDDLVSATP
jgi:uncharacterized protein YqgV (UPF0045/DUF77 family)